MSDIVLKAAIDFGTTFSGYAFWMVQEDKKNIGINVNWGASSGQSSYKCPTSVLVNGEGGFNSFGYEAEDNYTEKSEEFELYRNFKMMLYNNKDLSLSSTIKSMKNKPHKALDIFVMALKYLKGHLLNNISKSHIQNIDYLQQHTLWIITVPAIWEDKAKDFMREAAYKAGLVDRKDPSKLCLALEPEAASLFCRDTLCVIQPGIQYLLIDAGGGTVDITAHKVLQDGNLVELIPATGGDWGGNEVNLRFEQELDKIFGSALMKKYKEEFPSDWITILNTFERFKRNSNTVKKFRLTISRALGNIIEKFNQKAFDNCPPDVTFDKKNFVLIFLEKKIEEIFEPTIRSISEYVKRVVDTNLLHIQYIVLCGGFGQCDLLLNHIKAKFNESTARVLSPADGILAVVKGAVIYGQSPHYIVARVLQKTYGFETQNIFIEGVHKPSYKFVNREDGSLRCDHLFKVIAKVGDIIKINDTIETIVYPLYSDNTLPTLKIFTTRENSVTYIDEPGCVQIGSVELYMPIIPGIPQGSREILVSFYFGKTELEVQVVDKDKRCSPVKAIMNYWEPKKESQKAKREDSHGNYTISIAVVVLSLLVSYFLLHHLW